MGIVGIVFYSGAISARQAVFVDNYKLTKENALNFDDPTLARTFYGELDAGNRKVQFFSFKAVKGDSIELKLNVPRLAGLENFRAGLALFGPGLPKPPLSEIQRLPFAIPTDYGLVLSEDDPQVRVDRPKLDEPFTQTGYWDGQRIGRDFSEDGTYYVAVFSPGEKAGKYTLLTGDRAEAGLREIVGFPWLWLRLRFWFEQGFIAFLLLAAMAAAGFVYFQTQVRPKRKKLRPIPSTNSPETDTSTLVDSQAIETLPQESQAENAEVVVEAPLSDTNTESKN